MTAVLATMPIIRPVSLHRERLVAFARAEFKLLAALFVLIAAVLGFIEVADDTTEADGQRVDQAVLMALRPDGPADPIGPWWLEEAAADITSLGGISVLGLFAFLAVGFLLMNRRKMSSALLVFGLAGGVVLSEGLKSVFERERPPAAFQAVETLNASFPSGHALLSAVFYLTLGVLLTRAVSGRRLKMYVLATGALVAFLVGLTRIYLGAHWMSDVLAGWCVGAAWAMVLWLIAHGLDRWRATRQARRELQTSNTR